MNSQMVEVLVMMFALPAAIYFLLLMAVGFFSRLLFDAIAVLGFTAMLMAFLASSGIDALWIASLTALHPLVTLLAHRQLHHMHAERSRATAGTR